MVAFTLNPSPDVTFRQMGDEQSPLLILDNATSGAEELVALAKAATFTLERGRGNHFPGVRAPLPDTYANAMEALLRPHLHHFGLAEAARSATPLNALQMVTLPASDLAIPQKVPHFDTFEEHQIAVLHFLTHEDRGGTDFYRHRETGFERISEERFTPYTQTLVKEVQRDGIGEGYMQGADDRFELIDHVESKFDRVVAYFSNSLHSGHVEGAGPFPDDPEQGRLMASVFLRFNPGA
ncbi:hypothetical protein HK107_06480 [Parvularcula sp. ZS-1/3]|uniref:Uncharacterized protein n=1 Tax=Parvularcula mediterranea TaxID=2732508 RepID=A0A7Y3W564_9PROT|nr:DUF6445 family protein [Parvularcula mediterranea]NNU15967.1 hypothetical protein [Parvularcula mediterranea]